MGLLEDLRNQADNQRENEAAKAKRQAQLEAYYQKAMLPRMVKAFQYLTEFVDHLNYIKLETFVEYPLLPNGAMQRLQQQSYMLVIDSSKALKEIKFTMECAIDVPVEFEVFGKDAVLLQIDKIKCYAFRHECSMRKINHEIISAKFVLEGPLPLAVNINADVDTSKIKLELRNFSEPGYTKYVLTAEEFDDDFLDRLGKFVIRQERTLFGGEEISDAAKKVLRDKLIVERRIREQEMLEVEARIKAEEVAEKERSAKELLKRVVNSKVAQGKESLKEMFGKLKKQAGFDLATTNTTDILTPASVSTKQSAPAQAAPEREQQAPGKASPAASKQERPSTVNATTAAPTKPVQQAPTKAATAVPKRKQQAREKASPAAPKQERSSTVNATTAAPKPDQPAQVKVSTATPKPQQPTPVKATTAAPKPQQPAQVKASTVEPKPKSEPASKPEQPASIKSATVTPKPELSATAVQKSQAPVPEKSEQQNQESAARAPKNSLPPRVYNAPAGNPFLTPDEPEPSPENDVDSKLNQEENKTKEKPSSKFMDAKTSSANKSLTPEDLANDLVNIMQRDTQVKPEVKTVRDSVEKVKPQVTVSPESKLEPALKHEAKSESEFENNVEQKSDSAIKPAAKSEHESAIKLELKIDSEPEQKSEPATRLELKIEPGSAIKLKSASKPESELKSNSGLVLEPDLKLELEHAEKTSPVNLSTEFEGPDIDLSVSADPAQEEIESDMPLTSMFSRENKKPEE